MLPFLIVLHVLICLLLVISVLLQAGKGGGLSGSFGAGGSQALFGGRGAATFLNKATVVLGALFFVSSLALAMTSTQVSARRSLVQQAAQRAAGAQTPPAGAQQPPQQRPGVTPAPGGAAPSGAPATTPQKPSNPQGK
ncbi:MAG TPA: preprotein translocase subunit SecG [Candidatus Eisenbacteria bacterium]|nr:preprotein translocase subunit SecG [Candidatus Eisenbacteria bacterium]